MRYFTKFTPILLLFLLLFVHLALTVRKRVTKICIRTYQSVKFDLIAWRSDSLKRSVPPELVEGLWMASPASTIPKALPGYGSAFAETSGFEAST
jgi:hypothetical protein